MLLARPLVTAALLLALLAPVRPGDACTSIRMKTAQGQVFYARTMEYGQDLGSNVLIVPKGTPLVGTLPDGSPKGLRYKAKYGFVGMNAFNSNILIDGINEKGLMVGGLLFPGYAGYEPYTATKSGSTLAQFDLVDWLLAQCATVADVRREIAKVRVCQGPTTFTGVPIGELALHHTIHDATGASIVLEYVGGKLNIYDNPLGVLTNSPDFPWMRTFLSNTVNLSAVNVPALDLPGYVVRQTGQGSGMLGLPGDFTPPSRFVRMVALTQSALPATGPDAGLALAMTIIGNVDIPKGAVREKDATGTEYDVTQWAVAADTARGRYYYHTAGDKNWRYVDVAQALAAAGSTIQTVAINVPPDYPNTTATAKPIK
ncbi:linear amide C-N hydrolase [Desulfovibrio aerotolerans]|uniref:Linear amide C-N hydrolase n=1 Tax=Solidesulfovibrio aerotolerans TaxID=295255 RepID=A0A7C9J917_9BACT|nr:choloylglycine hydrolase family protein [Solidesulfovibrio aerotolerans]MYL83218.1 linear amide C-N hydrolase [Solidesulfovibrio aerotolerans]